MTTLHAIVLGIVQGLTEFLPVSSSGHLILFPRLFGWADQGVVFDLVLHMGTLCAVVIWYRRKLLSLLQAAFSSDTAKRTERRLALLIALSVIPAGVAGYLIETNDRSAMVVGISLIVWAFVLFAADRFAAYRVHTVAPKEVDSANWKDVALMSIAQAVALIPGTSRSGITMSAGLFRGLSKTAAADISFLMSIPILAVAGAVKLLEAMGQGALAISPSLLSIGFITSFCSGMVAISFLLRVIKRWSFVPFVVYRVALGIGILLFLA